MPELPDLTVYLECLRTRIAGAVLERVRLGSPFVLRSVEPPLESVAGRRIDALRRLGKRLVLQMESAASEDPLFLVLHLMIAGRLRWRDAGAALPRKLGLAAFDFPNGTLLFTEAGSKKRASLRLIRGEADLRGQDPGGLEVMGSSLPAFRAALELENHTLKRALTDPRLLSGIGNCLLRRDSPCGAVVAPQAHPPADRRRVRETPRGRADHPRGLDRAIAARGR